MTGPPRMGRDGSPSRPPPSRPSRLDQNHSFAAPSQPWTTARRTFITGAIITGLAVALGAFGAHGLKDYTDPAGLATWETAVRYQAIHGLALLILTLAAPRYTPRAFKAIAGCFITGTIIFSGSLYTLVLTNTKWLGAITPIGGLLFLAGWAVMALRHRKQHITLD